MLTPIVYKDWERLCLELGGQSWETGNDLPNTNLVFTTSEHLDNLFRDILENQDYTHKFILVSAASDSGVYYQNDVNGINDIRNWVQMDPNLDEGLGYHDYICRSRHEKLRCLARDKYALKMYSWMAATFPSVPANVVNWYTTNCQIQEKRVFPIPFGINPDALEIVNEYREAGYHLNSNRTNKVVASWTNTTNQRMYLKGSLDRSCFLTDTCPPDEYFGRLCTSKYCLCPEGNGLDSYRILECLYMGCLPLIVSNLPNPVWQRAYQIGLPIVRPNEVGGCLSNLIASNITLSNFELPPSIYLEYWEHKFKLDLINLEGARQTGDL